jgi:uncharacterized protein YukJ
MPLPGYGLLIGKLQGYRPPRPKSSHFLLFVEPARRGHPPYRVAINVGVSDGAPGIEVQASVLTRGSGAALVKKLRSLGQLDNFTLATDASVPTLDFVRDGVVDAKGFRAIRGQRNPVHAQLERVLKASMRRDQADGTLVAVFGTGYPIDPKSGSAPPTGFQGIENVHQNQGAFQRVGASNHFLENGANQDGAIIFLMPDTAFGLFVKFTSQSLTTDGDGRPVETGVPELDATPAALKRALVPRIIAPRAARPRNVSGATTTTGFVFADTNPNDADEQYVPDNDGQTGKAPYVVAFSKGRTRGPVPAPRRYPTLDLADVLGANMPGYTKTRAGESIAFDLIGDSGAPAAQKLPGERSVTALMVQDAAKSPPAFLFHLGDVVYFYGEKDYYYSQFYEPFQLYPAPIFAIPGNHDGITYDPSMTSLQPFQNAFCAETPGRAEGAGGILRTTMTQPGVYFTLDAPLVSIVGLYSNCSESIGWLDDQQLLFLYNELVRLKALRQKDGRAVILAIHHCPRWFPGQKQPDPTSPKIDQACTKANFWPDAVVCGHAHLYQRIVRTVGKSEIPYIINGAGGYGLNPRQVTAQDYVSTLDPKYTRLIVKEGYIRATVTKPVGEKTGTLRFEYRVVKDSSDQPEDICTIDLATNQVV